MSQIYIYENVHINYFFALYENNSQSKKISYFIVLSFNVKILLN